MTVVIETQSQIYRLFVAMSDEKNRSSFPLDLLQIGEEATIAELLSGPLRVHQLAEMGLRVGCTVRMIQPGWPCILAIDGRRLSLRLDDVEILVCSLAKQ